MNDRFNLQGKNALITGASRGIGLEIARGFLQAGAAVTICSRKAPNVDAALEQLAPYASRLQGLTAHVGVAAELPSLVAAAEASFGPLNILVNNAGTNPHFGPLLEAGEAAWDKTMAVNLKGPFLLSQLAARRMQAQQGGSIINIASVAGLSALPHQGVYSISKAGLIMLTKTLAQELGRQGIRVNCICPGLIKTRLSEALWADPQQAEMNAAAMALGRLGAPEDVVGAAIYLACDASSFATGAVLQVDGGLVI